jgi:GH25 family lysozyme M1 (1,4-beta-N-acetylmuramidase)
LQNSVDRIARIAIVAFWAVLFGAAGAGASDFSEPWKRADRALVIDAYEYNPIDWQKLARDKRIVGFINKASDGLSPPYKCSGNETETRLCKALWKRHAIARELFHTRRTVAKALGLKWGAYHLARPGNPIDQANNFIDFAEPAPDDLIALDIEENDPQKWMSLDDAETFVRHIHTRLGRWPVLYTNGSTALHIAENRDRYSLLSRLPLWYARYKPAIGLHFPKGHWQTYTLWQFSAGTNCDSRSCPYRVPGTPLDIDVNVASMSAPELRAAWPFGGLVDKSADTVATVPVPVSRRTAVAGGDVTIQYAAVEQGDTQASAEVQPEESGITDRSDGGQPEAALAELTIESGETVPLPISRRVALDGGDVTLAFAKVERVVTAASLTAGFPSFLPGGAHALPFQILLGKQPEILAPVELASYNQAIEKVRRMDLPAMPAAARYRPGTISAAALDDPGPILSATRFSRKDLPVFLLKKLDGNDEPSP